MLQIHTLYSNSLPLISGYLPDEPDYFSCCVNSQNSSVLAASNCLSCASTGINQKGERERQWTSKWLENLIFPAASVSLNVLNLHYLQFFFFFCLKLRKLLGFGVHCSGRSNASLLRKLKQLCKDCSQLVILPWPFRLLPVISFTFFHTIFHLKFPFCMAGTP